MWIVLYILFCVYLRPSADSLVNDLGLLYVYQIAEIAVSRFGFINANILSTAGGVDHGNTLLFINTSKGRFTLRVYAPDTEESQVQSEIYWLNSLNRDTNVSVPVPFCGLEAFLKLGFRSLARLKVSGTEGVSPYEKRLTPRPLDSPAKQSEGGFKNAS